MSLQHELLETVREVYFTERGVSFPEESTRIFWNNPDGSLEHEVGLSPLLLERPADSRRFEMVSAQMIVGWSGDGLRVAHGAIVPDSDTFARNFLSRFSKLYALHDHDVCLAGIAVATTKERVQTALYNYRDKRTGEITKY